VWTYACCEYKYIRVHMHMHRDSKTYPKRLIAVEVGRGHHPAQAQHILSYLILAHLAPRSARFGILDLEALLWLAGHLASRPRAGGRGGRVWVGSEGTRGKANAREYMYTWSALQRVSPFVNIRRCRLGEASALKKHSLHVMLPAPAVLVKRLLGSAQ
jgi:hypothetical protein